MASGQGSEKMSKTQTESTLKLDDMLHDTEEDESRVGGWKPGLVFNPARCFEVFVGNFQNRS